MTYIILRLINGDVLNTHLLLKFNFNNKKNYD